MKQVGYGKKTWGSLNITFWTTDSQKLELEGTSLYNWVQLPCSGQEETHAFEKRVNYWVWWKSEIHFITSSFAIIYLLTCELQKHNLKIWQAGTVGVQAPWELLFWCFLWINVWDCAPLSSPQSYTGVQFHLMQVYLNLVTFGKRPLVLKGQICKGI